MLAEAIVSAYDWISRRIPALKRKRGRVDNTPNASPSDPRKRQRVDTPPRQTSTDAGPSRRPQPFVRRPLVGRLPARPRRPGLNLQQLASASLSRSLPSVDDYVRSYVTPGRPTKRALLRKASEGLTLHPPVATQSVAHRQVAEGNDVASSLKRPAETSADADKRQKLELQKDWEGVLIEGRREVTLKPISETDFDISSSALPATSHQLPLLPSTSDDPLFDLPQLPEDAHPDFNFPDDEFSALSLSIMEDYLKEDLKAKIRSECVQDGESSDGISAFHPSMITVEDRRSFATIRNHSEDHVFFTLDNCDYRSIDVQRLLPGRWLNDNILNGYMKLLQLRDQKAVVSLSCHFCKTFLANHIFPRYSYGNVRKWTTEKRLKNWGQRQPSIVECDLVFFPVNRSNSHWMLVVADLRDKVIRSYDSLPSRDNPHMTLMRNVAQYLRDEAKDKLGSDQDFLNFRFETGRIPEQTNGNDCGVFVARAAKELGGGHHLNFDVDEMTDYRILIFKELLSGHVL